MHHTMTICSKSYLIKELVELCITDYTKYSDIINNNYKVKNNMTSAENALLFFLKNKCNIHKK
jgi:hypothetical protein